MDQIAARKLILMLCVMSSTIVIALIWAVHLFVEDLGGIQYVITAVMLISVLVTVAVVRPILMNAPAEPPQQHDAEDR